MCSFPGCDWFSLNISYEDILAVFHLTLIGQTPANTCHSSCVIWHVLPCSALTPQAVDAVGEILLSLSYLPTAERLTVVVAKCKNLVWTNGKNTAGQGHSSVGCSVCVCLYTLFVYLISLSFLNYALYTSIRLSAFKSVVSKWLISPLNKTRIGSVITDC